MRTIAIVKVPAEATFPTTVWMLTSDSAPISIG